MEKTKLINPEFLQKLETLQIASKMLVRGSVKGERASVRRGRSVEFADYRNYVPGDEIRIIDWNVYGRLDKLFIKLFVEEEELTVYLLLDRSVSMTFEREGAQTKFDLSRRIAAALAYVGLSNFDRVALGIIDSDLSAYQPPIRGKNQIFRIFDILENLQPDGGTSLAKSLHNFASRKLKPGLVVIISDFLDTGDFQEDLKFLLYQKHNIFLIQVLDAFEINPDIGGDLKLVDMETGLVKEVTVTDDLLENYKFAIENYCGNIRSFCDGAGIGYLLSPTSLTFEDLIMEYFRAGRLFK